MLELIIGDKGRGKTRWMMDRANNESKVASGSIIYIDKTNKHMYELSNVIRLINLNDYNVPTKDSFIGFVQGLISSNYNLTHIFLDNFMLLANISADDLNDVLSEINVISEKYNITFVISTSVDESSVPEVFRNSIVCRL